MAKNSGQNVDLNGVKDLLRYGNCVKECPSGDEDEIIECKSTNYTSDPDYFKKCVFYIGGVSDGVALRYPTTQFGGKFCIPNLAKALEDGNTYVVAFKEEFDKYVGSTGIETYFSDVIAC